MRYKKINSSEVYIFGTGIHARKVHHSLVASGGTCLGFVHSLTNDQRVDYSDAPVLRQDFCLARVAPGLIFPAIGSDALRRQVMSAFRGCGWGVATVIHPSSIISDDSEVGEGVFVGALAVVETLAVIGEGAIVDIGALVDHEVFVPPFTHVKPGQVAGGSQF